MTDAGPGDLQTMQHDNALQPQPQTASTSAELSQLAEVRLRGPIQWQDRVGKVTFLLLAALVLYGLVTSSCYTRQRLEHKITIFKVPGKDLIVQVTYPAKLFLDDKPGEVRINIRPIKMPVSPPTVRLDFPEGFIVTGTTTALSDLQGLLTFPADPNPQVVSIYMSGIGLNLRGEQLLKLCVQVACTDDIRFKAESPTQAAWRIFWTKAISDKAPVFLIAALLVPIYSQIINLYQRRREHEQETSERRYQLEQERLERQSEREFAISERREQLEQERSEYRNRHEQRRRMSEARALADNVRQHLVNISAQASKTALQTIFDQELSQFLPSRDVGWLKLLTGIANKGLDETDINSLSTPEGNLVQLQTEWPNESAGAFVCAMEKTKKKDGVATDDIRKLLGQFPLDRVTSTVLRDQYCRQWHKIQKIRLQDISQINTPQPDKSTTPLQYGEEDRARNLVPKALLPYGRAEWEETTLFGEPRGFFWRHPAYGKIIERPGNQIVYGQPGCGRTALALGLYYGKLGFTDHLRVHIPLSKGSGNGWSTIRRRWADVLLNYVCDRGTLLFSLSEGQRLLLANVLVQALSYPYVVAYLPHMLDESLEDKTSNGGATPNEGKTSDEDEVSKEEKRLFHRQVKHTQYALLAQAIRETTHLASPPSDSAWYHSTLTCCKALGVSGVQLLLDYPAGAAIPEQTIDELGEWQEYGVVSTFFMPTSAFQTVQNSLARDNTHELAWDTNHLDSLLSHLLRQLTGSPLVDKYFADDTRSVFIQSIRPLTPHQMVYLWRKILQGVDVNAKQITVEDVRRARNQ